jgi:hypothetical protein
VVSRDGGLAALREAARHRCSPHRAPAAFPRRGQTAPAGRAQRAPTCLASSSLAWSPNRASSHYPRPPRLTRRGCMFGSKSARRFCAIAASRAVADGGPERSATPPAASHAFACGRSGRPRRAPAAGGSQPCRAPTPPPCVLASASASSSGFCSRSLAASRRAGCSSCGFADPADRCASASMICGGCGAAARTALWLAGRNDVYFGVAPRRRRAGGSDAIERAWALWVDCDSPAASAALTAFRPAPSIAVRSGSESHRHAYWLSIRRSPPATPSCSTAGWRTRSAAACRLGTRRGFCARRKPATSSTGRRGPSSSSG